MGEERKHSLASRRTFLRSAAVLSGALFFGPPLLHLDNTFRAARALGGGSIDCLPKTEVESTEYPFDALAIPGSGTLTTEDGILMPNLYGQMRLEAAALAYSKKLAPTIILLDGGAEIGGEVSVSEKYLNAAYKNLTGDELPEGVVKKKEDTINTATNMEGLSDEVKESNLQKILVITNTFHQNRAILFACAYGVNAFPMSAEDLLLAEGSAREGDIRRLSQSWEMRTAEIKEGVEIVFAIWDPRGKVPTFLKRLQLNLEK
ncbi:hypothetical protein A2714_02480 [Candidatus Woesebacteria bacterium RIFCSPHIGHO2_01_FULL_38_9]|uniref:DUF218 domain-containing protein n=2 Tax=Candidatus Woeseibacteriota TaxID=1752722 RepID=A0A1F7Y3B6_9BACT|nr:MAG: hypothetical protein A2714_02480 [Candidatus Woesebacteria bacterium RIFCSPHIGHO2_01_FULL_38_9]OGM59200.1 MAG: hypothetical protein A3A75_03230 [Candidatus Woesebacteria bacterium RIFCSPLOWO2_01_FULL_39_10]